MPVHVALVDATGTVPASDLAEVAGALNEQVQADFAPRWHVEATVGAYPTAPPGTWRIELVHSTGQPGALGFHADAHHQPFALVDVDVGQWTVTASHELLEMLGDPWGNRLHGARALRAGRGRARACATSSSCAIRARRSPMKSGASRSATSCCPPSTAARRARRRLLPHRRSHRAAAGRRRRLHQLPRSGRRARLAAVRPRRPGERQGLGGPGSRSRDAASALGPAGGRVPRRFRMTRRSSLSRRRDKRTPRRLHR